MQSCYEKREKIRQYNKEYRQNNRDKINEKNKKYYKNREYFREYYSNNKEKKKEYYKKNKERLKEYYKIYHKNKMEQKKKEQIIIINYGNFTIYFN
jgi:hypothetical protein